MALADYHQQRRGKVHGYVYRREREKNRLAFLQRKGNELILSDKERVEKDGRLSFKHQLNKKIAEAKHTIINEPNKHRKRGEISL